MATLVLQAAGVAFGGLFGPVGAVIGRAVGGLAGAAVDRAVLGGGTASGSGARLRNLEVTASTEGTAIPRVWGRVRIAGQIIWATRLEAVTKRRRSGGGKGGGGSVETENTTYYANVALGLGEGPIAGIGRLWADGKPLDLGQITMRVHTGSADQEADPLIVAKEGAENTPAYRGLAYVVFERMSLSAFGNRVPQLSFEVIRPVGSLERKIQAITVIPGSTEFGYDTIAVSRTLGLGASETENRHTHTGETDLVASLDELQSLCPNLKHVSLVVAWFGDDLRAGHCDVAPRVDSKIKRTRGAGWSVCGLDRGDAQLVSFHEGSPAYGGTPADGSVIRAIREIRARGLKVTLYPFLMMDVPVGNGLPDPQTGAAGQPAYPWRGRIAATSPAEASGEIAAFFGTARPTHFRVSGGNPVYSGPARGGWRRCVLHMANLARAAGGVDALIIGSEFRDLTRSRTLDGEYPATAQLTALAADVRTMLGAGTSITYAADWTEYGAHVVDGGREVRFPLDPLWASGDVDAVGVDWYPPLADWREGSHADRERADAIYDGDYLRGNVFGGEAFDWFYAGDADRDAQRRTPITDGLGKPWIYRQKDLRAWWSEPHHERVDWQELPLPTAWVPGSKPIWLTEIGCPAVDKGANAPNVFPDPKSAEGAVPHHSNGGRDDFMQRCAIEAILDHFSDATDNPRSAVYGGAMVDPERIAPWTWDARPYPAFPMAARVWADAVAHDTGHWLTGRLGQVPLRDLVRDLVEGAGVGVDASALAGVVDGFTLDRQASAREALDILAKTFAFTAVERDGAIRCVQRGAGGAIAIGAEDLAVERGEGAEPALARAQEGEMPAEIALGFFDPAHDFQQAIVTARHRLTVARGVDAVDTPLTAATAVMRPRADIRLQDLWAGRETISFALAPGRLEIEPGDMIRVPVGESERLFEVSTITDGAVRRIEARGIAPEIFQARVGRSEAPAGGLPAVAGPPEIVVLDIGARDGDASTLAHVAAAARPWPGAVVLWRDVGGSYRLDISVDAPAIIGETLDTLPPGRAWLFDRGGRIRVRLSSGELMAASEEQVLAGANLAAAIAAPGGEWEIIQFGDAELVGSGIYAIGRLLRGQGGTEHVARLEKPVGSRFVLLDGAVVPITGGADMLDRPIDWRAAPAGRDHADLTAVKVSARIGRAALRPHAPVHLRGGRLADGSVLLTWIRRTRSGGDGWEAEDVPLGEEREAYRLEILTEGGEMVRRIECPVPHLVYSAVQEAADFGSSQRSLRVRVAQVSAVAGPGIFTEGNLDV